MAEHPSDTSQDPAVTAPAELGVVVNAPTTAAVDTPAPATSPAPLAAAARGESRTTRLYRAALGPVNTVRTLKVFSRFDAAKRSSLVWHPLAGLFTLGWLVFHRLWTEALVYAVVVAGAIGLGLWAWPAVQTWPPSVRWAVPGLLLLLGVLVPGMLAYGWLHRQVQRRVLQAVAVAQSMEEACTAVQRQAPAHKHLWAVAVAHAALLPVLWLVGPWRAEPRGPVAASAPVAGLVAQAPAPDLAALPMPVTQALAPATPQEPAPTARSEPAAPDQAAEPAGGAVAAKPKPQQPTTGFGINVGLFADEGNARRAHERLLQAGLPATAQVMTTPKGPRTRVRVGPFQRRAEADATAQRIRAMGLEAVVFRP